MFDAAQYELVDFGGGRKLERFGSYLLDRPSPAADARTPQSTDRWAKADARYERQGGGKGAWQVLVPLPDRWSISGTLPGVEIPLVLELKRTDFGHVGLFPEQAEAAAWVFEQVRSSNTSVRVLHLFAHTGCATLAAAAAGAEVTHVDSSASVVAWARRNAALSGLADAPVRWICEDAAKFVQRELARGRRYDAVILDPPSYGHGPKGQVWQIDRDLPPLVADCFALTGGRPRFMLLSCHSSGCGPAELESLLTLSGGERARGYPLTLATSDGRELPSGSMARLPA